MNDLEDFWQFAANFGIPKLTDFVVDLEDEILRYNQSRTKGLSNWEQSTPEYQDFSININRIAVFLSDIKNMEPNLKIRELSTSFKAKEIFFEHHIKSEGVFIFLVTTLEVYMESVFQIASQKLEIKKLNSHDLNKFCTKFHIEIQPVDKLLIDILKNMKNRIIFQNAEYCKIAFKLIGIDLPNIKGVLWQNIFDVNKKGSIMNIRHKIVHTGHKVMLSTRFSFKDIKEKTSELVEFIYEVEKIRTQLNLHNKDIVTIFNGSFFD